MQTLEIINVGQAANDGTGDDHRKAFQKVNANFDKAVEGIAEVGEAAQAAGDAAAAAIPATEKGVAGGVASLDAEGKIPVQYLPEDGAFIPLAQKGVAEGVATLGEDGKVSPEQLPNAVDAIPLAEKGQAGGVATLDQDGHVPKDQLPPIPSGPAVGTPNWWPLRSSVPAGQFPQDGQTIPRALCPDLTAMVIAGTLPVVAEATWLSDPTQRGKYTLGDGSTTIRLPDFNGKSAGSLGAVVRRGDGALSAGTGGLIQRDAFQNITGSLVSTYATSVRRGVTGAFTGSSGGTQDSLSSWQGAASPQPGDLVNFNAANSPGARTATETRALNVTGVWTVHAFGAVVNPGSVDAAQLASDYAVLNAAVQTLQGQIAQAFGVGQEWFTYDTSERAGGTYVNSTLQPIIVRFVATANAAGNLTMILNGEADKRFFWDGTNIGAQVGGSMLVPVGSNYSVLGASFNRVAWREYRKTK